MRQQVLQYSVHNTLLRYAKGEEAMCKDVLQRNLKLVWRIINGVSELCPPEQVYIQTFLPYRTFSYKRPSTHHSAVVTHDKANSYKEIKVEFTVVMLLIIRYYVSRYSSPSFN